jgi:hypothetical protein
MYTQIWQLCLIHILECFDKPPHQVIYLFIFFAKVAHGFDFANYIYFYFVKYLGRLKN